MSLTVLEDIKKEITTKEKLKVPMSLVFGRGTLGDVSSFGGKSLAENTKLVDQALANVGELQTIWNHSHTQWMWKHLNLSWHAPYKNMRQISAEITNKKSALNEAKWRHLEAELEIRKIEEELSNVAALDYWKELELNIKLAKLREGLAEGIIIIEGAMKDVLVLNALYEQLKSKVSNFSEEDIEKEETKNHLKRSLVQSIRDVRMQGCISKGEQEYLEQIGVNPSKVQVLLKEYVIQETQSDHWDIRDLYEFVDRLTDELVDIHKADKTRMYLQGFNSEACANFSSIEKLAKSR